MPNHKRLTDFLEYIHSINDDQVRPWVIPFEGVTIAGGAGASAPPAVPIPYQMPDDRETFIYEIRAVVQPPYIPPGTTAAGGLYVAAQVPEYDLSTLVSVDVMFDDLHLFGGGAMSLAAIIGTQPHNYIGIDFDKLPYHFRQGVRATVTWTLRAGFPTWAVAGARLLGLYFMTLMLKHPNSGL